MRDRAQCQANAMVFEYAKGSRRRRRSLTLKGRMGV